MKDSGNGEEKTSDLQFACEEWVGSEKNLPQWSIILNKCLNFKDNLSMDMDISGGACLSECKNPVLDLIIV